MDAVAHNLGVDSSDLADKAKDHTIFIYIGNLLFFSVELRKFFLLSGLKLALNLDPDANIMRLWGALTIYPCLFCPSDNAWHSRCADAPKCAHFSTLFSLSWITEQISVGKCAHQGALARWERQTSFKILTWTKQTWTKHHNTDLASVHQYR